MLCRLLLARRVSLVTTLAVAVAISLIGFGVGTFAGYWGGAVVLHVDHGHHRCAGPGLGRVLLAAVIAWRANDARVARAAVLTEREEPYVESALGTKERRISCATWSPMLSARSW